jgi:hypothetical protein
VIVDGSTASTADTQRFLDLQSELTAEGRGWIRTAVEWAKRACHDALRRILRLLEQLRKRN